MKQYILPILGTVAVGVGVAWLLTTSVTLAYRGITGRVVLDYEAQKSEVKLQPKLPASLLLGGVSRQKLVPETLPGKTILADLESMKLTLYQDGVAQETFPIQSKGRPGSPWETPAGEYKVLLKEKKHFSSIGEVWMPWSIQFFGNFFIHGWPTKTDGEPVSRGYSGGCVRLETADAKKVYDFAELGATVLVRGVTNQPRPTRGYQNINGTTAPTLTARVYLLADLETGEVIASQESETIYPIASITKLMTSLISLEAINQSNLVTVSEEVLATGGEAGGLTLGEKLTVGDLLYPLLLESSNDASEAIARNYGRDRFVALMNEKARAIGLNQTTFTDPSGIDEGNRSTAHDLFRFADYLYRHKRYPLTLTQLPQKRFEKHLWLNNNPLVANDGYLGGKTGQTTPARQTLVALLNLPITDSSSRRVVLVLLQSEDRNADASALIEYFQTTFAYQS